MPEPSVRFSCQGACGNSLSSHEIVLDLRRRLTDGDPALRWGYAHDRCGNRARIRGWMVVGKGVLADLEADRRA